MPSDMYQAEPPQQPPEEEPRERQQHRRSAGTAPLSHAATISAADMRPRTATDPAEIDETLSRPGSVRINVKGAFIVDQESPTPTSPDERSVSPGHHETKDIRLPNHTAVVSHIAIDVCRSPRRISPRVPPRLQ